MTPRPPTGQQGGRLPRADIDMDRTATPGAAAVQPKPGDDRYQMARPERVWQSGHIERPRSEAPHASAWPRRLRERPQAGAQSPGPNDRGTENADMVAGMIPHRRTARAQPLASAAPNSATATARTYFYYRPGPPRRYGRTRSRHAVDRRALRRKPDGIPLRRTVVAVKLVRIRSHRDLEQVDRRRVGGGRHETVPVSLSIYSRPDGQGPPDPSGENSHSGARTGSAPT